MISKSFTFSIALLFISFSAGLVSANTYHRDTLSDFFSSSTPPTSCKVSGCSGQLCVPSNQIVATTCQWRDEYACYKKAKCELQRHSCGWTFTEETRQCFQEFSAPVTAPFSPSSTTNTCTWYIRNNSVINACASCGNGFCEAFETCSPTTVNGTTTTKDCGKLYCPSDCKDGQQPIIPTSTPTPPPPTPRSSCGNGACEPGEFLGCSAKKNCVWAGTCPQDCFGPRYEGRYSL